MNYYELLEVSPNASQAVIRAAYKSLMQRYHPDKNPGDAAIAQTAALVVQAFEVLSDDQKRAEYDLQLRQAKPPPTRRAAAPTGKDRTGGTGWLAAAVLMALAGWAVVYLPAPANVAQHASDPARRTAPASGPREIARFITELNVALEEKDSTGTGDHAISIPVVGIRVGTRDPGDAIRHLRNVASAIDEQVRKDLAAASFEELLKPGADRYLSNIILQAVCKAASPSDSCEQAGDRRQDHYGAVEVLLPQSFSVR